MSWSYSGDPGASTLDLVRFLIQDTDTNDQLLSDEEILYLIGVWSDPYAAAIGCVSSLIAKASRGLEESKSVADLSITRRNGSRLQQWQALLKQLEAERFRLSPAAPVANEAALNPTHIVEVEGEGTDFVVGQMDNLT